MIPHFVTAPLGFYILNLLISVCKSCANVAKERLAVEISFIDADCSSVAAETFCASSEAVRLNS